MPKQKTYILCTNDIKEINRKFYEKFDPEFIHVKADTFWFIDQHRTDFISFVAKAGGEAADLDDNFFNTLHAEIHFSFFHQCETLFALIFAGFQKMPHWLYLTTYETREIKARIQEFIDNDFTNIGGESVTDDRSFLHWGVYTGAAPSEIPVGKTWNDALDNLAHFLRIIAKRYLAGTEYNAYKHGIRILHGKQGLMIQFLSHPGTPKITLESDNALAYLELKDKGEKGRTVHQTIKFFSIKEDFGQLQMLAKLGTSIKNTRLEYFGGKAKNRQIVAFYELDKEQLDEMAEKTSWTLPL